MAGVSRLHQPWVSQPCRSRAARRGTRFSQGGNAMFTRTIGALALGSCLIGPGTALAQERAPHTGSTALGVDAGIFIPKESALDDALVVNALFEYYMTP